LRRFLRTFERKWKPVLLRLDEAAYIFMAVLLRKEVNDMAVVYATLIVKGVKTFAEVPETQKAKVKEILIALDCGDLAV